MSSRATGLSNEDSIIYHMNADALSGYCLDSYCVMFNKPQGGARKDHDDMDTILYCGSCGTCLSIEPVLMNRGRV